MANEDPPDRPTRPRPARPVRRSVRAPIRRAPQSSAVIARLRETQRRLAKERAQRTTSERNGAAKTDVRIKQLERRIRLSEQNHKNETALYRAGITDPEEVELVKFAHSRLPARARPSLADWVGQIQGDPRKAPKLIQGLTMFQLQQRGGSGRPGSAPPVDPPQQQQRSTTSRFAPNRVSREEPPGTRQPTRSDIEAARVAASQGNRKPLEQLKAQLGLPPGKTRR